MGEPQEKAVGKKKKKIQWKLAAAFLETLASNSMRDSLIGSLVKANNWWASGGRLPLATCGFLNLSRAKANNPSALQNCIKY